MPVSCKPFEFQLLYILCIEYSCGFVAIVPVRTHKIVNGKQLNALLTITNGLYWDFSHLCLLNYFYNHSCLLHIKFYINNVYLFSY